VYAIDRSSGKLVWRHTFQTSRALGRTGVAYGWGSPVYGRDRDERVSHSTPKSGEAAVEPQAEPQQRTTGIDHRAPASMTTPSWSARFPGAGVTSFYKGGTLGVVWALDAVTGKPKWTFNTVKDGKLWGKPEDQQRRRPVVPRPPVDSQGARLPLRRQPGAVPRIAEVIRTDRAGPAPTSTRNSLVVLDGQTGKLLWYRQTVPHDVRDYDLEASAIVATLSDPGAPQTEVAIVAGKMGKAYAYRARQTASTLWTGLGRQAPERHRPNCLAS